MDPRNPQVGRAFALPALDRATVTAVKALAAGEASAAQQKLALDFTISRLAGTHHQSFRPDDQGGERETCFAEGRRWCGNLLRWIIVAPVDELLNEKGQT